jgi:hypothetical protein
MKYITIVILSVAIIACSATKKSSSKKDEPKQSSVENKFDLSMYTKSFLVAPENFVPSEKLINKYSIKKVNGTYTISGFIKINDSYQEKELTQLNIKTGSAVSNIVTVIITLESIDSFLLINGINYFEIGEKVEPKN